MPPKIVDDPAVRLERALRQAADQELVECWNRTEQQAAGTTVRLSRPRTTHGAPGWVPEGIDMGRAKVARVYDDLLGGCHNLPLAVT